jgi:thiol:disulfide interchange protein DsbD
VEGDAQAALTLADHNLRVKPRTVLVASLFIAAVAAAGAAWWLLASRAQQMRGAVVLTQNAEAELVAAREAAEPGQPFPVALRLKAKPGWHTYWRNPGDSGQPTSIEWNLPAGFSAGAILWPVPQRFQVGPLANYGYEGEVLLKTEIRVPAEAKGQVTLAARARWLVCDPDHCIPEQGEVALSLPVGRAGPSRWSAAFEAIRLPQPPPARWKLSARREGDRVLIEVDGADEQGLFLFPYEQGKVQHAAPQPLERTGTGVRLAIPVSSQPVGEFSRVTGILAASGGRAFEINVPVAAAQK